MAKRKAVKRKAKVSRQAKPMQVIEQPPLFIQGEELVVKIETKLANGDGVAWIRKGFLFIPHTEEGQHYKVRVVKAFKKTGIGEAIAKVEAPPHEVMQKQEEKIPVVKPQPAQSQGPIQLSPKQPMVLPVTQLPPIPLPPKQS